jgi:hypothetical protein
MSVREIRHDTRKVVAVLMALQHHTLEKLSEVQVFGT